MEKKIIRRQVADKTRTNIIKAAHKLFAEHGFSGTTTQAIAQAAHVNETLIFHHFGTKAELWKKVKSHVIAHIPIEPLDPKPTSLRLFLNTIIQQRLSAFQQQPDLIRLLQWQRLESKQDQLSAKNILAPRNWLTPIKYLQKKRKINAHMQPEIIMIWLLVSINAILFDNHPFLQSDRNQEAYLKSLITGFEQALAS